MRSAELHHVRRCAGQPLLLIHGLGSSWRSWSPILPALEAEREVIAVDLSGFGETPALLVERWGSSDELGILKQLGVDPAAG